MTLQTNFKSTSEIIKFLMEEKKITPYRICKDLGFPYSSFRSMMVNNRWNIEYLKLIANYFNVSIDQLALRSLNEPVAYVPEGQASSQSDFYNIDELGKRIRKVPAVAKIGCGIPYKSWDFLDNDFEYFYGIGHMKDPFVVIAQGDSMRPYINPGDKLLCCDAPEKIKNKTAVVVSFKTEPESYEGNAKLIKYLKNDQVMLYSINTKYDPEVFSVSEIYKIFKIVKIIRDVK